MSLARSKLLEHLINQAIRIAVDYFVVVELQDGFHRHVVVRVQQREVFDVQKTDDVLVGFVIDGDA